MNIFGIETSCDETAAAVVKDGKTVLSSSIASSQKLHVKTGGIIPEVAARKQIESIIPVIEEALSLVGKDNIDAIAVTYGPGLIGSLLVGVETAKTLAMVWDKPIIPVNHLVAHIYANWIESKREPEFPAVALVVSGGHTDFVLIKNHQEIEYIGGTRDDAAGEAFDKTARLLDLPYPGGPEIAKAAEPFLSKELSLFPRPMINEDTIDTSFSGLKTAVLKEIQAADPTSLKLRRDELAAQIQEAIVDTLVSKSLKAVEKYKPKSFLLAGGVSANKRLREKITESLKQKTEVFIPNPIYSTDNAVMIAAAAFYNHKPVAWADVNANPSLSIEGK